MLSNLLQELALARDFNRKFIVLDEARLNENPVDRLSRMIRHSFWDGLTRSVDSHGLERICKDPKNRSKNRKPRIYIPFGDDVAWKYFTQVAIDKPHLDLEVERLPEDITPQYVKSLNQLPGILSLGLEEVPSEDGTGTTLKGTPFVVPGGRFNEMYGWDSYFESLGLIIDGRVDLAKSMVDNFVYQIRHYGKILNANRSYYLTRSQPPFLTDMALQVYHNLNPKDEEENKRWLAIALRAAIKEYYTIWMSAPRYDHKSGLSCYHPTGIGMPPETESTHFNHIIEPYAQKLGLTIEEYNDGYNNSTIIEPKLDKYFVHDRAVRESGHDTTYRLEKRCADLATVDLNCLLYRYEVDIARTIRDIFHGQFQMTTDNPQESLPFPGIQELETSRSWFERAELRQYLIDKYMWNEEKGLYFDYNIKLERQSVYESVTATWALWAGCVSEDKAERLKDTVLDKFEATGGLVCGTEESRGLISLDRPNRQWDYPFGWAPHQIMAWEGFKRYGFTKEARRLAYRWLFTITKSFVDFNGVVPEKFDIVSMTHQVKVEYGNVGVDFKFVPREGFGWMNASYQVGLTYLTSHMRRALGTLISPDDFFSRVTFGASPYPGPTVISPTSENIPRRSGSLSKKFAINSLPNVEEDLFKLDEEEDLLPPKLFPSLEKQTPLDRLEHDNNNISLLSHRQPSDHEDREDIGNTEIQSSIPSNSLLVKMFAELDLSKHQQDSNLQNQDDTPLSPSKKMFISIHGDSIVSSERPQNSKQ
jgi:alpha,alpha-trehalase